MNKKLQRLAQNLDGEFYTDDAMRILYATDASAYREIPLAVAIPKSIEDIKKLIAFAHQNKTSLIPRTAGTSLAGRSRSCDTEAVSALPRAGTRAGQPLRGCEQVRPPHHVSLRN